MNIYEINVTLKVFNKIFEQSCVNDFAIKKENEKKRWILLISGNIKYIYMEANNKTPDAEKK